MWVSLCQRLLDAKAAGTLSPFAFLVCWLMPYHPRMRKHPALPTDSPLSHCGLHCCLPYGFHAIILCIPHESFGDNVQVVGLAIERRRLLTADIAFLVTDLCTWKSHLWECLWMFETLYLNHQCMAEILYSAIFYCVVHGSNRFFDAGANGASSRPNSLPETGRDYGSM